MEMVLVLAAATFAAVLLWWLASSYKTGRKPLAPVLPPDISITPVPLLTQTHVLVYNLLRLAVHDRYLIFAQVPLWSFVHVEAAGKTRSRVFSQIALKRVDFVLVHPGSRQVEQVVQVEEAATHPYQAERQQIIESVLDAAGITLRQVRPQTSYSVSDLTTLLGLEPEE